MRLYILVVISLALLLTPHLVHSQSNSPTAGAPPPASNSTTTQPPPAVSSNSTSPGDNVTTDAAGRLTLVTPAITSVNKARFRIGDNVTIAWKYDDNVQVKPANLTIAISTDRRNWMNVTSLPGGATKYVWQTGKWDENTNGPLMTSVQYYGVIYDERGWDAPPQAGYLMANFDLQFQFYASGANFCAACNGAADIKPSMVVAWMVGAMGALLLVATG